LIAAGQNGNKMRNKIKLLENDTVIQKLVQLKDSIARTLPAADTNEVNTDMDKNMNYILELQKERKAKQKRNAIIRIAIGVGLLILLIIGWKRKSKK
jgi:hypothetical protein